MGHDGVLVVLHSAPRLHKDMKIDSDVEFKPNLATSPTTPTRRPIVGDSNNPTFSSSAVTAVVFDDVWCCSLLAFSASILAQGDFPAGQLYLVSPSGE